MGSDDFYPKERPAHRAAMEGFWIDPHPITRAEFGRFVAATGHVTVAERPPRPDDYPDGEPALLVPGSLVFRPPPGPVPLDGPRAWWAYVPGACWQRPEGLHALDDDWTVSGALKALTNMASAPASEQHDRDPALIGRMLAQLRELVARDRRGRLPLRPRPLRSARGEAMLTSQPTGPPPADGLLARPCDAGTGVPETRCGATRHRGPSGREGRANMQRKTAISLTAALPAILAASFVQAHRGGRSGRRGGRLRAP